MQHVQDTQEVSPANKAFEKAGPAWSPELLFVTRWSTQWMREKLWMLSYWRPQKSFQSCVPQHSPGQAGSPWPGQGLPLLATKLPGGLCQGIRAGSSPVQHLHPSPARGTECTLTELTNTTRLAGAKGGPARGSGHLGSMSWGQWHEAQGEEVPGPAFGDTDRGAGKWPRGKEPRGTGQQQLIMSQELPRWPRRAVASWLYQKQGEHRPGQQSSPCSGDHYSLLEATLVLRLKWAQYSTKC